MALSVSMSKILENADILLYNLVEILGDKNRKNKDGKYKPIEIIYGFHVARERAEELREWRIKNYEEWPTSALEHSARILGEGSLINKREKDIFHSFSIYANKCRVLFDLYIKNEKLWFNKKDPGLGVLIETTTPEIEWEIPEMWLPKGVFYVYNRVL